MLPPQAKNIRIRYKQKKARFVAQDTIDLVGHCGLGQKAETHFCDVDKHLKNKSQRKKSLALIFKFILVQRVRNKLDKAQKGKSSGIFFILRL